MKHKAFTLWEVIVVLVIIGILAAILFPVFARTHCTEGSRPRCQSNLKQIGLGYLQYAQDAGEKYPILTTKQGWVGALYPYTKTEQIRRCPTEQRQTGKAFLTSYWFNRHLAGAKIESVENLSLTFLMGDGAASDDPNVSLQSLPPQWAITPDSPARRHLDTGNYLFADGHVKSLKPEKITLDKPSKNAPTFLVGKEKP